MAKKFSPDRMAGRIEHLFEEEGGLRLPVTKMMDRLRIRRGDRTAFLLALHGLEADGRLRRDTRGRYYAPEGSSSVRHSVVGELTSLHPHFGFVATDQGDCFVPGDSLHGALPGDRVKVVLGKSDHRGAQGRIREIVQPGGRIYTGRLYAERQRWYVAPTGGFRYDLPVVRHSITHAAAEDMVRFTVSATRSGDWIAEVLFSYGSGDSARVCADAYLDQHGIPMAFSEEALSIARQSAALSIDSEEEGREDLRDCLIFTIDGADAKDLDDAISLEKTETGWLLGVHIADVSYYVPAGTALDREALERGTSVYFADRVIPMLPPELSNGACSLNPGEDKRALSALLTLDENGTILDCRLCKSLIRSRVRGVYDEVNALFTGEADPDVMEKYRPVAEALASLRGLAERMGAAAERRGVINLMTTECRIRLNERGEAEALLPRSNGEAERLIEQMMIAANTAVATLAKQHRLPFVYRIHETPNIERLGALLDLAGARGLPVPSSAEGATQRQLQVMMQSAQATPYARLISDQLLRCMAKARYDVRPVGHYGLALADYCHFTSPIRRYPDLMIHRVLSSWLDGVESEDLHRRLAWSVAEAAYRSTHGEIRAMSAERYCESSYKAEYMLRYVGTEWDGMVVSAAGLGLFVELDNTVCGLLPLEDLPGSYLEYDGSISLVDGLGRPRYTVGQPLRIRVVSCDVPGGHVRFALCPDEKR